MPRNSSGSYSLPAGNPVISGTSISTTWANSTLGDLAAELSDSLSRSGKGGIAAPLRGADGTVAAPSYSFTSEVGTGAYRAGASDYRIALAGVDKAIVTAAGLAIGAPNPNATLSLSAPGQLVIGFIETTGAAGNMRANLVYDAGAALGVPGLVLQNVSDAGVFAGNTLMLQRDGLVRLLNTTAIQPASIWTAIVPAAGFAVLGGGFVYMKDAVGFVHLKGGVSGGSGTNPVVFTLPVGFRPTSVRVLTVVDGTANTTVPCSVNADGTVTINEALPAGHLYYFDSVVFVAEQ